MTSPPFHVSPRSALLVLAAFVVVMASQGGGGGGNNERLGTGCQGAPTVLGLPPKNRGVRDVLENAAAAAEAEAQTRPGRRTTKKSRRGPVVADLFPFEEDQPPTPPAPVRHDNAGGLRPFLVVHADPLMSQALVALVDAHDYAAHEGAGPVWLYEEMHRWNHAHAAALWNFTCGRTRGRWPACGSAVHGGPDPFDRLSVEEHERAARRAMHHAAPRRHHTHRHSGDIAPSPRPLAVGFPVDLNHLYPASDIEGAKKLRSASKGLEVHPRHEPLNVELLEAMLKRRPRVVILASKSLTRRLLREAVHGSAPLRAGVRGRRSGVSRALFGPEGHLNGAVPGSLPRRHRHIHQLCGVRGAPKLITAMLRHYSAERKALLDLGDRLIQRYGLAVNILDVDGLVAGDSKGEGVHDFYSYALGDGEPTEMLRHPFDGGGVDEKPGEHWAVPGPVQAQLAKAVRLPDSVLEDCADALARARVRVSGEETEDRAVLMADLDHILAQIERERQGAATKPAAAAALHE